MSLNVTFALFDADGYIELVSSWNQTGTEVSPEQQPILNITNLPAVVFSVGSAILPSSLILLLLLLLLLLLCNTTTSSFCIKY